METCILCDTGLPAPKQGHQALRHAFDISGRRVPSFYQIRQDWRVYTLGLSVVTHVLVVAAVVMIPLYATDVLPEPYRAVAFVHVTPIVPDPPPLLSQRERRTEALPATSAPISEPDRSSPRWTRRRKSRSIFRRP